MPIARSYPVKSLFNFSMHSVLNCLTFHPVQINESVTEMKKNNNPLQLPVDILQEILYFLRLKKKDLVKEAILYLVSPEFQCLKLYPYYAIYTKLFPKLRKLQVLELSGNDADDDCLKVIGTHCKNLRVLDIDGCYNVSDVGIQWLCSSIDVHGGSGSGKCKSLEILLIRYCYGVTKKGIQMALENLPSLKVLHHEFTFDVLIELSQKPVNQRVQNVVRFPLTVLRVMENYLNDQKPFTIGSIGKVLPLCPFLVKLEINLVKGITDTDLLGLTSLKMLRELIIYRYNKIEIEVTFDTGVAPLLVVLGNSLANLNLSCFDVVNFRIIIEYCPNLSFLTIKRYHPGSYSHQKLKRYFQTECRKYKFMLSQLEMLHLDCDSFISPDIWFCLLYSPLLHTIDIKDCDTLTDDVFQNVTKVHRFQNLEYVYLTSCNSITYRGIDIFMIDGNPLRHIEINNCKNLTEVDVKNFKIKYRDFKWALRWTYDQEEY